MPVIGFLIYLYLFLQGHCSQIFTIFTVYSPAGVSVPSRISLARNFFKATNPPAHGGIHPHPRPFSHLGKDPSWYH